MEKDKKFFEFYQKIRQFTLLDFLEHIHFHVQKCQKSKWYDSDIGC